MISAIIALVMGANSLQLNRPATDIYMQVARNATEAQSGSDHHDLTYSPMLQLNSMDVNNVDRYPKYPYA